MIHTNNLTLLIKTIITKDMSLTQVEAELNGLFSNQTISSLYQAVQTNDKYLLKQTLLDLLVNKNLEINGTYKELCIKAIKKDGLALRFVDECYQDDFDFYQHAVKQSGLALEYIRNNVKNYGDLCMLAVEENPSAALYVSRSLPYEVKKKIFLKAVSIDGLALEYIFEAQNDMDVCLAAIEENIYALEFVHPDLRALMINKDKAEAFLERNYMTHVYFSKELEEKVNEFLMRIQHVIAFDKRDLEDKEISDVQMVYANSLPRKGKTVCVTTGDLEQLLKDLASKQGISSNIHLVILGHANVNVEKIAGLGVDDMTKTLETHPIINHLTLFGCKSVQAYKLEEEKDLIRKVSSKQSAQACPQYGLLIMMQGDSRTPEKLLGSTKLNATYVIVQDKVDNQYVYSLSYIERNAGKIVVEPAVPLNQNDVIQLQNSFCRKKDLSTAFSKNMNLAVLRNQNKALTLGELELLGHHVKRDKFHRDSPLYKQSKSDYPFLQTMTINLAESKRKLTTSFLQKLIKAIELNQQIKREITLKGYSQIMHVDRVEQRFHGLPDLIYTKNYYRDRLFTNPNIDNLDRKKLALERAKMIKDIETGQEDGETLTKAIKVVIK